jgi:serine/threonine protein kinase
MNNTDTRSVISDISQSTRQAPFPLSSQNHSSYYYQQQHQLPNYQYDQQRVVEEEVQKGVEKVLLAILEASKSNTPSNNSSGFDVTHAAAAANNDNMSVNSSGNVSEVLLKAMDEILKGNSRIESDERADTYSSGMGSGNGGIEHPGDFTTLSGTSKMSVSSKSHESQQSKRSGGERSVVDELLAEADEDLPARYWPREEKKMTENERRYSNAPSSSSLNTKKKSSQKGREAITADIDELIQKSLRASITSSDDAQQQDITSEGYNGDDGEEEDEDLDSIFEADGEYDDEDEDGLDDDEGLQSEVDRVRGGVLGPLSRNAGGTTGVVLDSESESVGTNHDKDSKSYFSSVVKYVTAALTPDKQRVIEAKREVESQDRDDVEDSSVDDVEAMELMRTLCAHLLPFGVDRKSNLQEVIPAWDEDNPNEAGYRIIRLSKSQLRRVECAFESMITGLKSKSQNQLNGVEGEYDANFIRELQEAERLLDDEEKRNLHGGLQNQEGTKGMPHGAVVVSGDDRDVQEKEDLLSGGHPDFPGIKAAGNGEMGDLEYFHLPIIFKSHVTGFEPTKDMVLEPGNIIAGQYLVENELGSAAFSTAYRCIDLSSDNNDGHEEVCLKVIKNTKDFFDQSLDEIKILELLRQTGKCDENYIIRMKTFFYYREHLIIVTELLRQNLFEFGKFILDNDEEPYFTIPRLAYITRQCLVALRFVHSLGLVHSDVKPENILLGSYSRAQIKLIDFGSSCYLTDRQSSYIQSRSYRAPEVVLGLPYDGKIDVWSLGCVVAEMYTGEVTFQNDSIVSMLSRIEAICGSFPRHMVAQGRQSGRFFTKSGLLYEVVDESDQEGGKNAPGPNDDESDSEGDTSVQFDIFQPKSTRLSSRLGFDADLMDDFASDPHCSRDFLSKRHLQQIFTDFVARLLTIDPDGRPTAHEALQHPWMKYAASLTEDQIKYPTS